MSATSALQRKDHYMTLEQASEYLNIPARSLRRRIEERVLKAYKPGKRLLFKRDELDMFVRSFTV